MARTLGWIAAIGLGVGVVSSSLAWALGGHDLKRLIHGSLPGHQACEDTKVSATASERRLPWTGDDTTEVVLSAPVRLIAGPGSEVVIRGAPEAIAHIRLQGGRLSADCRGLASSRPIEVELPARALRHVRLSGSVKATLEKLSEPELKLTVSGSGNVQAAGAVERAVVTISGSGDVRLGETALRRLTVKISGSGTLEAAPKDEADLTISGSGTVRLLSRPASLHTKVSGSGRISQPPVESADKK